MGNFYFLSAFLHISNSLQWICITVIICKRLVLKFIWNYNFMVVILQSKLFCLHVEFSFLPFFLCAFPHLYFYCPAFSALIDQLSSPVRHSGCTGLSDVCIENDLNSTRHAGAVSWPHAHSAPWPLHALPTGRFPIFLWQAQSYIFFHSLSKILFL